MARSRISERELDVMQVLWSLEHEAPVADIHAALPDLAYTTVQTMLNRLETKGQVRRRLEGRTYLYSAAVKAPAAASVAVRTLIDRFFQGSAADLAAHLVEKDLSDEEISKVRKILDGARKRR